MIVISQEYDFRPKSHETKLNYHFIIAILKSQNSEFSHEVQYLFELVACSLKSRSKKAITSHFAAELELMQYKAKMVLYLKQK